MDLSIYKKMIKDENDHWWFRARRNIIESFLKIIPIEKNSNILDIGTCTGYNLNILNKYGRAEGLEPAEPALNFCKEHNVKNVIPGDITNYESPKKYNLVTAFDVVEHIENEAKVLQNINRCTTDKGYLLVTVPALPFMWSSHDVLHQHYRRYTKESLEKLLETYGYKVHRITYFNTLLFPIAFIERTILKIINKFGMLKKSTDYVHVPNFVNKLLYNIMNAESILLRRFSFPIGLSLICLAQKI